jgi:hypothetical protein
MLRQQAQRIADLERQMPRGSAGLVGNGVLR